MLASSVASIMGTPVVELQDDHLRVRLDAVASVTALSGDLVVPYSTVESVDVVAPEWPSAFPAWRVGLHLPGVVAKGRFASSWRGPRRFLWLDRRTRRVLRLRLRGHPQLGEVALDVPDAEALADSLRTRLPKG